MTMQSITIELPEEIVNLLGAAEPAPKAVRRAVIVELLREGKISQGKAAELLGISMWEILDLIVEHDIQIGPQTAEEIDREVEAIRRLTRDA